MDWLSWLSRTGLDPTLVHEYGVAFTHNELERDDIPYFTHELLQSMGISIAKHRLEILKLAGKVVSPNSRAGTVSRAIIAAAKRTKRCLSEYLRARSRRDDSSALAVVPRRRWKWFVAKKNKRPPAVNRQSENPLLLTNGIGRFASPNLGDRHSSSAVEDIRWDSMFQNLKPN